MTREPLRTGRPGASAVADGGRDGARNLGRERHRILRELRRELERHPAVEHAIGAPDGRFRELHAELDPTQRFPPSSAVEHAALRIAWWPAPDDPEFAFHYSDSTGFDCGWHREPNPHVDGKTHYQERDSATDDYEYEPVTFDATTPTRLLWSVLDRLTNRV